MATLKTGETVADGRLGRIVQFDERSRGYPIRGLLAQQEPEAVKVRAYRSNTWACPWVGDQGVEGACVGFGVTAELAARPSMVAATDADAFRRYYAAQDRDPWPGGEYPGAWPRYSGTSVLAGVKVAHAEGYFREYRWAFGLSDVLLGIGYHGPAVIGINWHESMYEPRDGRVVVEGPVVGGHCLLVNGVSVRDRTALCHNSWGPAWGRNGEAVISWDDLGDLLADDGEAVFFVGRRTVPKPA